MTEQRRAALLLMIRGVSSPLCGPLRFRYPPEGKNTS